jgi:hypothetical protein
LLLAIAGWMSVSRQATPPRPRRDTALIVALAYFSLLGLATIAYFLNRPVSPTLVGGTFYPWGVCLVLLWVALTRASRATVRQLAVGAFVLATVCCTAFTQVVFPPSFGTERTRLADGRVGGAASVLINDSVTRPGAIEDFIRSHAHGHKVAIVTFWPNMLALGAGVESVTPFSSMIPATFGELDLLTRRLRRPDHPDVFLYSADPYPEIQAAIIAAGYHEIALDAGIELFRWKAG